MSDFNIQHVAKLARLELTSDEQARLSSQLGSILEYIEHLKKADVSGIEPTSHAFPLLNVTRPDERRESIPHEDALANAPLKSNGLFIVPKIVE